ncbi:hypothetical protein J6590_040492 [Homalodisca vitripennis]|nr:hypothetical protein J6590_040492 [Homalodisca vitripennis]
MSKLLISRLFIVTARFILSPRWKSSCSRGSDSWVTQHTELSTSLECAKFPNKGRRCISAQAPQTI